MKLFRGSSILLAAFCVAAVGIDAQQPASGAAAAQPQQAPAAVGAEAAKQQALMRRYCMTCHNTRLKTADLMFDTINFDDVGGNAETFEKVFRNFAARDRGRNVLPGARAWVQSELDKPPRPLPMQAGLPCITA